MYKDTVTIFNRKKGTTGYLWYPTVLAMVNLNIDKGEIFRLYGDKSSDNAVLNVRYRMVSDNKVIGESTWLPPKEWAQLSNPSGYITFSPGDFFWEGTWTGSSVVSDDAYGDLSFYDYMLGHYDNVFAVTSVAYFSVIPHMEVAGR